METGFDVSGLIAQIQALASLLLAIGVVVTGAVDTIKPIIVDPFNDRLSEPVRRAVILVLRYLVALLVVGSYQQIASIYEIAPSLESVNIVPLVLIAAFAVVVFSEVGHQALDILAALKAALEGIATERKALAAERVERSSTPVSFVDREAVA